VYRVEPSDSTEIDMVRTLLLEGMTRRELEVRLEAPTEATVSYFTLSHGSSSDRFAIILEPSNQPPAVFIAGSRKHRVDPDFSWFHSDPSRVQRYAGQWVAVLDKAVVGFGSPLQASSAANHALVFYVEKPAEREKSRLGL